MTLDRSAKVNSAADGSISLGCSNILNTFQIVNETGTNNTTYYSIQGRKYTVTYMLSF
jgi:hypothetical protein